MQIAKPACLPCLFQPVQNINTKLTVLATILVVFSDSKFESLSTMMSDELAASKLCPLLLTNMDVNGRKFTLDSLIVICEGFRTPALDGTFLWLPASRVTCKTKMGGLCHAMQPHGITLLQHLITDHDILPVQIQIAGFHCRCV